MEIINIIRRKKKLNALGLDRIPNLVLIIIADKALNTLLRLYQAYLSLNIQPRAFKQAITVPIRKTRKENYIDPKSFRPIALLNTLEKVLESIILERLQYTAETYSLLLGTQIGARRMRSIDTALQLITEKIYRIQGANKKRVASLLYLDIFTVFDRVSHKRLIHNLRKRYILALLINQISDFLRDRETTIKINDFILESSSVFIGILQGFLLSLILYLFYRANLLDLCDDIKLYISGIEFIDNANILIYSYSI